MAQQSKQDSSGYWESVAGSVIQATGTVEFEDGLRTGVLQEDCWCPYSGRATLESEMAGLDPGVVQPHETSPIQANRIPMAVSHIAWSMTLVAMV